MNDEMRQAYSRLQAHEYALQWITATVLSCMPAADAERWLASFMENAQRVNAPYESGQGVSDIDATTIIRDGVQFIENFADKVGKLHDAFRASPRSSA